VQLRRSSAQQCATAQVCHSTGVPQLTRHAWARWARRLQTFEAVCMPTAAADMRSAYLQLIKQPAYAVEQRRAEAEVRRFLRFPASVAALCVATIYRQRCCNGCYSGSLRRHPTVGRLALSSLRRKQPVTVHRMSVHTVVSAVRFGGRSIAIDQRTRSVGPMCVALHWVDCFWRTRASRRRTSGRSSSARTRTLASHRNHRLRCSRST
jgi:hypothetical protein